MTLTRAQRRRAAREAKKGTHEDPGPSVRLQSPEKDNFETFIVGNYFRAMAKDFDASVIRDPHAYIDRLIKDQQTRELNAIRCHDVVKENEAKGQTLVIAGAGPSLAETAHEYCAKADQVWGCNSALIWLHEHGLNPTHGFTMDQTVHMCEEWYDKPDVEYLIATTVHVHLLEMLLDPDPRNGGSRRVRFFNNYVGLKNGQAVAWPDDDGDMRSFPYEDWLYALLYHPTIRCGSGLNATTRALDVADFMGFEKIYVLGADCALRFTEPPPDAPSGSPEHLAWLEKHTTMHADGGNALASGATAVTFHGHIDGRLWLSKPDLMVTAVWLEGMRRYRPETIEVIGDVLPNALRDKPIEFIEKLPGFAGQDGKTLLPPVYYKDPMEAAA